MKIVEIVLKNPLRGLRSLVGNFGKTRYEHPLLGDPENGDLFFLPRAVARVAIRPIPLKMLPNLENTELLYKDPKFSDDL